MRAHRHVIVATAVAVASAASAGAAVAQPYGPGAMHGWGGGFWPLGMFIWPVILLALVALAVWAVRSPRVPHMPRRSSGLDALEERYARGEIGRDEYLQKKADIGG